MSKNELATTVIMPNMYCYECHEMWRGGPRCPNKCPDSKIGEIEKLDWFEKARTILREAQKHYHKSICQNINGDGLEDNRERFYGTLDDFDNQWNDAADVYVSLFLNALDAQFLMALKVFLTTVAFRSDDETCAEVITDINADELSPTMCPENCIVEPSGWCPHGYDSLGVLLNLV